MDKLLSLVPNLPISDTRPTFATDRTGSPSNSLSQWLCALSTNSFARQLHEETYSMGTRLDLVARLHVSHPVLEVSGLA